MLQNQSSVAVGLHLIANSVEDLTEKAMVARWRAEYELYAARRLRPAKILEAIAEGYDTLAEITYFTNIPEISCYRILMKFVREKRLRAVKTKNLNKRLEFRFEII